MISELQGKTNQIQSLNSQPTFADMLINVSAVQFNQNVEKKLAAKGVKIAPSTKRRNRKPMKRVLKKLKLFLNGMPLQLLLTV